MRFSNDIQKKIWANLFCLEIIALFCLDLLLGFGNTYQEDCSGGKYGINCEYNCSHYCNSSRCRITATGVPECYNGCKQYHTGVFCMEFCPSLCIKCDQRKSICLKCIDGYYGASCIQTCHEDCANGKCEPDGSCTLRAGETKIGPNSLNSQDRCLKRNEQGECVCCGSSYRGTQCERECSNCQTFYIPKKECVYHCVTGYYGHNCNTECPRFCEPGNAGKAHCKITKDGTLKCENGCINGRTGLQCDEKCSETCVDGTCYQKGGKCIMCHDGKYGNLCLETCTTGCDDSICFRNGTCTNGCNRGFYGSKCTEICPENCKSCSVDDSDTLSCNSQCTQRHYGMNCTENCSEGCRNNVCSAINGKCEKCEPGLYGNMCSESCGKQCKHNTCEPHYGHIVCVYGCNNGFTGALCNESCHAQCRICEQHNGNCTTCKDGYVVAYVDGNSSCVLKEKKVVIKETGPSCYIIATPVFMTALCITIIGIGIFIIRRYKESIAKFCRHISSILFCNHEEDEEEAGNEEELHMPLLNKEHQENILWILEAAYPCTVSLTDVSRNLITHEDVPTDVVDALIKNNLVKKLDAGLLRQVPDTFTEVADMPSRDVEPTIAIVTSLFVEKLAIDAMMEKIETFRLKKDVAEVYTFGTIRNHQIVSTKLATRPDQQSSCGVMQRLFDKYKNIEHVFVVGVAGAAPDTDDVRRNAQPGDVVVSRRNDKGVIYYFFTYDERLSINDRNGEDTFSSKTLTLEKIAVEIQETTDKYENYAPWKKYMEEGKAALKVPLLDVSRPKSGNENKTSTANTRLWLGAIASGNQYSLTNQRKKELANEHKLVAFDEESNGVMGSIPECARDSVLIVRGIVDFADGSKGRKWEPYSSLAAAAVVKTIIKSIGENQPDGLLDSVNIEMSE